MTGSDMAGILVGLTMIASFILAALTALLGYWVPGLAGRILLDLAMIFAGIGIVAGGAIWLTTRQPYSSK